MEIKYVYETRVDDYLRLRKDVGWSDIIKEDAQKGLDHSFVNVSAFDEDLCVGAARLLWDRGYFAFLADVMVEKNHQGKGIGKTMVQMAIDKLMENVEEGHTVKIELIPAKGRTSFYEQFDFVSKPESTHDRSMARKIRK